MRARRAGGNRRQLRIGTRGSLLARRQAAIVMDALCAMFPTLQCTIEVIRTEGDEAADVDFSHFAAPGVFVRRIEAALLDGRIDLAVHSFKDLPSSSPDALTIAAFLPREDPRDALVSRSASLASLPDGATVGTGSARRQALIRDVRPRLDLRPIRGNVDTRLGRVARGDLDAVVVAAAGLARLERSDAATEILDPATFIPSPGQGILAVQARRDDPSVYELAHALDDPETRVCAQAERSVAVAVDAGCQTPFGAYAKIQDGEISVSAFLAPDGVGGIVRRAITGSREDALEIGGAVGVALATAAARAS